jgi:hypothetical protein
MTRRLRGLPLWDLDLPPALAMGFVWAAYLATMLGLASIAGCGAIPIKVELAPQIEAEVDVLSQEDSSSQAATAGGNVEISRQRYDQWAPRIDAATRFVDQLKKWSVWLILGIPLATYVVPKLVWLGVQRVAGKKKVC